MLSLKKSLAITVAVLGLACAAQATVYTTGEILWDPMSSGETHVGSFDLTAVGFQPGKEVVTSATVVFVFLDDLLDPWCARTEAASVALGGDVLSGWGTWIGFGVLGSLKGALSVLNQSGVLSYTVTATHGDSILIGAGIVACAKAVPDTASTLALFGLGLLSLAAIRRKVSVR